MAGTRVIFNSLARKFSAQVKAGSSADTGHAVKAEILWKRISLFVGIPACILCAINTYIKHKEHESEPRPEFIPYDHMYIRTKRFPWGDGQHSFFHNPHKNALPTGYEDEH